MARRYQFGARSRQTEAREKYRGQGILGMVMSETINRLMSFQLEMRFRRV
jgi:hypothetical protein